MKARIIWYITGVLLILVIGQFLVLASGKRQIRRMPIFLPPSLEFEQRQKELIHPQYEGSYPEGDIPGITVDDLVRGMLSMEQDKDLALSKEQAIQIFPELQKMAKKRARLLRLRNKRHRLNEVSTDMGIHITHVLSPAQFNYIINNRDQASLLPGEESYWDSLINSLEKRKE